MSLSDVVSWIAAAMAVVAAIYSIVVAVRITRLSRTLSNDREQQ